MSHFYSSIQGGRGEATRCGHKTTGIEAMAKNWEGKITVQGTHDHDSGAEGEDIFKVFFDFDGDSYLRENPSVRGKLLLVTLRHHKDLNQWHIEHHVGDGQDHNVTAQQAEFNFVNTITTHSY